MDSLFARWIVEDPWFYATWVVIVIFSICVHEYAHARMALSLGDPTAAQRGHLSLNPMIQMGPVSLVVLALFGIAWGAVPVDVARLSRKEGAAVAFAGPASNLILSVLAALMATVLGLPLWGPEGLQKAAEFFRFASLANGVLFLLNMLPVPMLDGWAVFSLFFPSMAHLKEEVASTVTTVFLMALFLTPVGTLLWTYGGVIAETLLAAWGHVFALVHPGVALGF